MHLQLLHKATLCARHFLCGYLMFVTYSVPAQDKATLNVKIKAFKGNALYDANHKYIGYVIKLRNNISDNQQGKIYVDIKNSYGQSVYSENIDMFAAPKRVFYKDYYLDNSKFKPGFYFVSMDIRTNHFGQVYSYAFVVEPEKLPTGSYMPPDFTSFWDKAKQELVTINPQYQISRRGDMSTVNVDVFQVEFQSIQSTKIRGWLSVPKSRGKYPVLYKLPSYVTPAKPEIRVNMAVFCLDVRGIGSSADNVQLNYNNYLTTGISNKLNCIYRDVYMDCLRGLDFIFTHQDLKLDITKIVIKGEGQGASLAAAVAGLYSRNIQGLIMERPVFLDMRTIFAIGEMQPTMPWPLTAFKSYLRNSKTPIDNFFKTWDYFDAINFATLIKCPVLIGTSLKGTISLPQCAYNFYNQILSFKREIFICADNENNMDASYYVLENNWIREILRIPN